MLLLAAATVLGLVMTPLRLNVGAAASPQQHRFGQIMADGGAPSLREQMMAYIKSVQERGMELTEEQQTMIAEFEADDDLLDQTGRVDFMRNAEVLTPEELAAQSTQEPTVEQLPTRAPLAPLAEAPIDPAAARLWAMQQTEVDATCQLLRVSIDGGEEWTAAEAKELRRLLSSLVCTLSSAS